MKLSDDDEQGRLAGVTPAVELIDVVKRFGDVVAVEPTSLAIEEGQLVTLLGPSGCGKTTTLRMIAGLELASEGTIRIDGQDVTKLPATARDVSMVFQSYALFPHMSVLDNVAYGLVTSGRPKVEAHRIAEAGLARVGLEGLGQRLPSALSGGQQQRVAVARALVLEPKVLLFDEPLSNLDARLRRQMREDIRSLQREVGFTAVYVTHDQDEALAISDRIVLMNRARIAQDATPHDLFERPTSAFAARFIGEANIVDVEVLERGDVMATIAVGALRFEVAHRGIESPVLAARPYAVRLGDAREGLRGEILTATYLGDHREYVVRTDQGELFVTAPAGDVALERGAAVGVTFDLGGVVLVEPE